MDATAPLLQDMTPGVLAWSAKATSVADIERALGRIWAVAPDAAVGPDGERHVVARTSVLNFVAVAGSQEAAARVLAAVGSLTGRHPSRTIVVEPRDVEGPRRIEAEVTASCRLPRGAGAAICTETVRLRAGGDAGRHLASIVPPLLVHDLPVTLWWPEDVPFHRADFTALLTHAVQADRLVVDGSAWRGDGLAGVRGLAHVQAASGIAISDFALMRQSRWRDALASAFDGPDLLPYLGAIRSISVEYAASRTDPAGTNVVRPLYHAAWIGSRLGWSATGPLVVGPGGRRTAVLRRARGHVDLSLVPVPSDQPGGATTRVRIVAERRGSRLDVEIMGRAEAVIVRFSRDGGATVERVHHAVRRTDADLLAEAVESGGRDRLTSEAIRLAGEIAARAEAGA